MPFKWWWKNYGGDPDNPAHYSDVGSTPPSCPGSCKVCAIYAEDDGLGNPVIDAQLQAQITAALKTCVDQPRVLLRTVD